MKINNEKVQSLIKEHFTKIVQKDPKIHNAYLLVHSEKLGVHLNVAEGLTGDMLANTEQPYFIASIGKLFTSVLISILVEKGMLTYEDTITQFLEDKLLQHLHIFKGKDYTSQIKIKHLLNHTSGLHDYFGDKPKQGSRCWISFLRTPHISGHPRKQSNGLKSIWNPISLPEKDFIILIPAIISWG